MTITPNNFKVTGWYFDPDIFSGAKGFNFPVKPEFGAAHIIGATKTREGANMPMIILGVQWYYELFFEQKSILKYIVEDDSLVSIVERNNDKKDLDDMIKSSYDRAKKDFHERLKKLNSNFVLHPLEQSHIDNVREDLLAAMKARAV